MNDDTMTIGDLLHMLTGLLTKGRVTLDTELVDSHRDNVPKGATFPIGETQEDQYIIIRA